LRCEVWHVPTLAAGAECAKGMRHPLANPAPGSLGWDQVRRPPGGRQCVGTRHEPGVELAPVAIGGTGEAVESQLVAQGVGDRSPAAHEAGNVGLEGGQELAPCVRVRPGDRQVPLLGERVPSLHELVPQEEWLFRFQRAGVSGASGRLWWGGGHRDNLSRERKQPSTASRPWAQPTPASGLAE
jgi:hypothetical protein